jgi:glutathione S-transferase
MQLYFAPRTRAIRPRFLLEELGVPFEIVSVELSKGQHKQPDYLEIHPHGAVPALVDGGVRMFESAAICLYLADKFPAKKLAPAPGSPERAAYYQWMVYAMATLEPPVVQYFLHSRVLPEDKRSAVVVEENKKRFDEIARVLTRALSSKEFILGAHFTAADVLIGSILIWVKSLGLLEDHPALQAYTARIEARPAYQRAQG